MERRRLIGWGVALGLGMAGPVGRVRRALAAPLPQGAVPGGVVKVRGSKHVFVGDEAGLLHWAGDSRALGSRAVDWGSVSELPPATVLTMQRGDPWLSAGLVKDGNPIYLAKWETGQAQPTLQQIQSIGDVEAFGITGSNYGQFVIERPQWEQQYGFPVASLRKEPLDPFAPPTITPPGTRLRVGETWVGLGLNLTLVQPPADLGGYHVNGAAHFEVQNTSNQVLNFEVPHRHLVFETNTGVRWLGNPTNVERFTNLQPGERKVVRLDFPWQGSVGIEALFRDPRTTYWEINIRDFGTRIPEAHWRESVAH